MSINLADKYSQKVAERFSRESLTDRYCGKDYDFVGVKTISIWSIDTVATTNYTRSGSNRFGTVSELGDTKQELTLEVDKAFTFSIDAGNASEQFNIKQANACLKRELDEVVTPEIDAYRLSQWVTGHGLSTGYSILSSNDGVVTKANIVEKIFTGSARMSDAKVPHKNRVIFIPELTFLKFKLADVVMGAYGDRGKLENVRNGYQGTIDGMDVVTVPASIFPSGYNFIIKYKDATVDVMKLQNFRIQKNPQGIDGDVVEGRYIYDSFVLNSRCSGVFASSTATGNSPTGSAD